MSRSLKIGIAVLVLGGGFIAFALRDGPSVSVPHAGDADASLEARILHDVYDSAPAASGPFMDAAVPDAREAIATSDASGVSPPKQKPAKKSPEAWVLLEKTVLTRWFGPHQTRQASQVLQDMCDTMANLGNDFAEQELNRITDGGTELDQAALTSVLKERFETQQEATRELSKLSDGKFSVRQMKELMADVDFGRACPNVGEKRDEVDE